MTGTRQQKMAEKVDKNKLFYTSFLLQQQIEINQQSINNQSDKMDYADVNDA